jgi:5'-3' exonuclease
MAATMKVHLIDGTYELFRQHFGMVRHHEQLARGAAAAGVVGSTLQLVADGATHVAVASDHVIESFRNELWPGYKSSEGMLPELLEQIPMMERALEAAGFTVWPMVEFEADDALGAAAAVADADQRVEQVLILTPDKDLGQCVRGTRVVQFDRRKQEIVDEAGVIAKFGVPPSSIADYLALVGDSADGFPGLQGWGAKGAATVLARWGSIDRIPASSADWELPGLRGAEKLAVTLRTNLELALLFRRIATVETDVEVGTVDEWRWRGPTPAFEAIAAELNAPNLYDRAVRLAAHAPR